MAGDRRFDFGPSLKVYNCVDCGKSVLNRGCPDCEQRLCKAHYPEHCAYRCRTVLDQEIADSKVVILTFQPGSLGIVNDGDIVVAVAEGSQAEQAGVDVGWRIRAVGDRRRERFNANTLLDAKNGNTPYQVTFDCPVPPAGSNQDEGVAMELHPNQHYCGWCGEEYTLPEPRLGMCCDRPVKEGYLIQAKKRREQVKVSDLHGVRVDRGHMHVCKIGTPHAGEVGLRLYDKIVAVNGKPVPDYNTLQAEIQAAQVMPVTFVVLRHLNSARLNSLLSASRNNKAFMT